MIKLFLDANIYLNFYRMSDEKLFLLDTLIDQILKKKIELVMPEQVIHEFRRNKSNVINETIIILNKQLNLNINPPVILKSYKKVKQIEKMIDKLVIKYKELIDEFKRRALNPQSDVNKKLNRIMSLAKNIGDDERIIQKAYFRHLRGDPPQKDNHDFGDCILWETLLENESDSDLVIITKDGDYEFDNLSKKGEINEFIKSEWASKKGKNVRLFKELTVFLKPYFDKKEIRDEKIKEAITEEVGLSKYSNLNIGTAEYSTSDPILNNQSSFAVDNRNLMFSQDDHRYATFDDPMSKNYYAGGNLDIGESTILNKYTTEASINICKNCRDVNKQIDKDGICPACKNPFP